MGRYGSQKDPEFIPRNLSIVIDLMKGYTLRPTAIHYGVSHTRIEQIVNEILRDVAPQYMGMDIRRLREFHGDEIELMALKRLKEFKKEGE